MVNYDEFKALSDDQKIEILKELKEKYATTKEMASALGISPMVMSNFYKRYVEGVKIGRKAKVVEVLSPEIVVQEPVELKEKPKRGRKIKTTEVKSEDKPEVKPIISEPKIEMTIQEVKQDIEADKYVITIRKSFKGNDIKLILNGLTGALFDEDQYKININIEEI